MRFSRFMLVLNEFFEESKLSNMSGTIEVRSNKILTIFQDN